MAPVFMRRGAQESLLPRQHAPHAASRRKRVYYMIVKRGLFLRPQM